MFFTLALKSLRNRKGSVLLTIIAMTVSIFVLLAVEHIRYQAKESFANTVSGVDLIVGSRTSGINLLMYSVFRIGSPTNNIDWDSYQSIANKKQVKWAIPISLGDSHKGYRVMGTTQDYFKHFSYGKKHQLTFANGKPFDALFDVVIGSEIAARLNYKLGDEIILSHGIAATSFSEHDDKPFTITGILKPTGTPVDQTLHVSLEGIEAIHIDWQQGVRMPGKSISNEQLHDHEHNESIDLKPKSITAFMLGLNSRLATFAVQRDINNYRAEPLSAILPGVALSELWQMMSVLESTMRLIAVLILVAALLGLSAMLLSSIRERNHEVQLLRVIGASPLFLFGLIELEALLITLFSIVLAALLLYLGMHLASDFLIANYGLFIRANIFSTSVLWMLLIIILASVFIAAIPSLAIYRSASKTGI